MKVPQTHAEPKTDIVIRGVETHEMGEAQQILKNFQQTISQIPEVEKVRYKHHKDSIKFLVVVDRIRRELSTQLSQIECRLCDEYTDWFFGFEHIGSRTFSQQSRAGYANLFSRD